MWEKVSTSVDKRSYVKSVGIIKQCSESRPQDSQKQKIQSSVICGISGSNNKQPQLIKKCLIFEVSLFMEITKKCLFLNQNIEKRKMTLIKKGKVVPDKILDLHGLTAKEAEKEVGRFLIRNYGHNHRFLLIITGKGGKNKILGSDGVLKRSFVGWIENSPWGQRHVQSILPAHGKHGGSGAFYVYLKRNKMD